MLAAAACGLANAQTTAYTTPVGYVSLGNTAGAAVPANTDMTVAIPLARTAEWRGTVASVSGNVVTLTGTTGFTNGQWVNSNTPFVVEIGSGSKSGLVALVAANTTVAGVSTLTLSLQGVDTLAGVAAADKITIRKAWTIGSLFAGNSLPDNIEFSLWEGSTAGTDNAPDKIYYYFAGVWYDSSDDSEANNIVLYPNEGFRLRTSNDAITSLVVSGEVPMAKSRIFYKGGQNSQDSRVSFFGAIDEPIKTSGLGANNDQLLSYSLTATGKDNAPSAIYYFFDGAWYDASDDSDVTDTLKLKAGVGYVYRTAPGAADTISSDLPDYVPSL